MKTGGKLTKTELVLLTAALGFLLGLGLAFLAGSYTVSVQRQSPAAELEAPAVEEPEAVPQGPVDINAASLEELDTLPGIVPALAQRIIDCRTENGPFQTLEDLTKVRGIGPATLEELRGLAVAGAAEGTAETDEEKNA